MSLVSKAALALASPFGLVPIWATVLIGNSEMALGVTENAMRLSQIAPERMHSEAD